MLESPSSEVSQNDVETNVVKKVKKAQDFVVYVSLPDKSKRQYIQTVKAHDTAEAIAKVQASHPTLTNGNAAVRPKNFAIKAKKIE